MRAARTTRTAVIERLKAAHDEGRLTLGEFSDRSARARQAQTRDIRVQQPTDPAAPALRLRIFRVIGGVEVRNG